MPDRPVQVKIVKLTSSTLIVRLLANNSQKEITANELVRKVEEGKFELVE